MLLTDEDVERCLQKAQEVIEQYRLYPLCPRDLRSIDDLEWILTEFLNRPVVIYDLRLDAADRVVRGMFVAKKDGTYEVYRLADLGDRERRFVTCKELFHVILDDEHCRNMDLLGHLESSQTYFTIEDSPQPGDAVKLEMLAEIGAMEFLFPYARRREELARAGENPDFGMISAKYGVPQIYVEAYLSDNYMAALASFFPE